MREHIARGLGAATVAGLVVLAGVFARTQNRPDAAASPSAPAPAALGTPASAPRQEPTDSARGQVVFEREGCTSCHSAAGVGSPRLPLDGVALRRSPASLRAWTTGNASLADSLAPATLRRKQDFARLPAADLDALLDFLESLRSGG